MGGTESSARTTRRGRPPVIAVEDIYRVVAARLDSGWTVASVAAELGVSESAIYHYFPNKKALLAAVAAWLFEDTQLPRFEGSPADFLRALGLAWFDLFLRHPAFLDLDFVATTRTGSDVIAGESLLNDLVSAGFTTEDAWTVGGLVYSVAFTYSRMAVLIAGGEMPAVLVSADSAPIVAHAMSSIPDDPIGETFRNALDLAVAGALILLP